MGSEEQKNKKISTSKNDFLALFFLKTEKLIFECLGDKVSIHTKSGVAKLSVVGIGMRSHSGVAAHMFEALAEAGINIQMISTSEIKTAVTIRGEKIDEAARVVHSAFGLDNEIADETSAAS